MATRRTKAKKSLATAEALITGFPGFLATFLLEELLRRQPETVFHFLVQKPFLEAARQRAEAVRAKVPEFSGSFEFVVGDITDPKLGLDDAAYKALAKSVGVVWHLAAIYDLTVPELHAYRVNVAGTNHILDFCAACKDFKRHNYISTCFVSGERKGTVFEDELDEGQSHHNNYESTKFWAEVEVRRRMDEIPTTILRPAIVVGDSRTGQTDKYDGPYYLFKLLRKLPSWAPFPNIGDTRAKVNIIPVDFAARAIAELGLREASTGETYHVADPNPMTAEEILDLTLKVLDRPASRGRIAPRLVETAFKSNRVENAFGIPREVIRYFTHSVVYDTARCEEALAESGIQCPHLSRYLQVLVDYVDRNPDKEFLDHRRL